jgi:hypothetical protein
VAVVTAVTGVVIAIATAVTAVTLTVAVVTAAAVTAVAVTASALLPVFLAAVDFIFKCYKFTFIFLLFI